MNTVHLVLSKERLDPTRGKGAIAIVLDIIFATSSILAALEAGASSVLPAMDLTDALRIADTRPPGTWIVAGESNAQAFEGHRSYQPLALATDDMSGKDLIYATTNGTIALRRAHLFDRVYAACLRNGPAVARHAWMHAGTEGDIVLVCSGSRGKFSLEDFYGAGYLVSCLRETAATGSKIQFSDASLAAEQAFMHSDPYQAISSGRLGQMMLSRGLQADLQYVAQLDTSTLVGVLDQGRIVKENG